MNRLVSRLVVPGLALFLNVAPAADPAASDAKAADIAQSMMKAMGGQENWVRAPIIRFDFRVSDKGKVAVDRAHLWEKKSGRYRLEGKTKEGQDAVTLFNVATREGTAYVNGKKLEGAAATQALKDAYGAFINDMYWLAMPWKWTDPGVNLKYLGKRSRGAESYDIVQLTFGKVGLTPGDKYEAYVSPRSHLMEYWKFDLQSGRKDEYSWEYTTTGGIKLAKNHTNPDGRSINMGDVEVLESAEDSLFTDPAKKLQ
jgi:hypothetical protein